MDDIVLEQVVANSVFFVRFGASSTTDRTDEGEELWARWSHIVNNWEDQWKKQNIQIKELVRRGIPLHFRAIVWQLLCAAADALEKKLYAEYIKLKESRIYIQTTYNKESNKLHSILSFDYVTWQDGGRYTCLQPSIKQDSVKLVVVEAEFSEAMQSDLPLSSRSTKKINVSFRINIYLILTTKLFTIVFF